MSMSTNEAALACFETFTGALTPHYTALHAQLAGNLATNAAQLEDLRAVQQERIANFELFRSTADLLPLARWREDSEEYSFRVQDSYTARQVQANVLWALPGGGYELPHYIFGERPADPKRGAARTDLLVMTAKGRGLETDPGFRVFRVYTAELEAGRRIVNRVMHKPYEAEELKRMFVPDGGELELTRKTMPHLQAKFRQGLLGDEPRLKTSDPDDLERYIAQKEICFRDLEGERRAISGPTNEELTAFDVHTHLFHLAVAFQQEEGFKQVLANQPA